MLTAVIVIIVIVVAAVVAIPTVLRSYRLRRRFGPEYHRLTAERGDRRAAERELAERQRLYRAAKWNTLDEQERAEYTAKWSSVQETFVDDPAGAIDDAETLTSNLLQKIGYPPENRELQLALASVEHADAVSRYRHAREQAKAVNGAGAPSTETLRLALRDYRGLFEELLTGARRRTAAR